MSKFGKNLVWFMGEVSTSLEDLREPDGDLPDAVDVYGEDEQGRECCCEVGVIDILDEAKNRIEELEDAISKTIGFCESTGGNEEAIRLLREVMPEQGEE